MTVKDYLKNVCSLEKKLYQMKLFKSEEEKNYQASLKQLNQNLKKHQQTQLANKALLDEKCQKRKKLLFFDVKDNTTILMVILSVIIGILGISETITANVLDLTHFAVFPIFFTILTGTFIYVSILLLKEKKDIPFYVFMMKVFFILCTISYIVLKILHVQNAFAVVIFVGIFLISIMCSISVISFVYDSFCFDKTKTFFAIFIGTALIYSLYVVVNAFIDINFIFKNVMLLMVIANIACVLVRKVNKSIISSIESKNEATKKYANEITLEIDDIFKKSVEINELLEKTNMEISNLIENHNKKIAILDNNIKFYSNKIKEEYNKNILNPKYQNWVAAATIYEYLDMGRAKTLEGFFGAYNLYENEAKYKNLMDLLKDISSSNKAISIKQSYIVDSIHDVQNSIADVNSSIIDLTL